MGVDNLILALGEEIADPGEETFLLFSQSIPSQNLGFIDAKATSLELTVSDNDLTITQSPGLLSSNRAGGTTGAVVWKITPLIAEWITLNDNVLFKHGVLDLDSQVLELGCGISGIVPIVLLSKIARYIATDQEYVFKLLKQNIEGNLPKQKPSTKQKAVGKSSAASVSRDQQSNIDIIALDWETSSVSNLSALIGTGSGCKAQGINVVLACDCIYNEALIEPFVRTCVDLCQPAPASTPTVCVIAQQLRSDLVFQAWLSAFHIVFRVWRVPHEFLIEGLREGSGFVVHIGYLRETAA